MRTPHVRQGGRHRPATRMVAAILAVGCFAALLVERTIAWIDASTELSRLPLVIAVKHGTDRQNAASSAWAGQVEAACECAIEWHDVTPDTMEGRYAHHMDSYAPDLALAQGGVHTPDVFVGFEGVTDRHSTLYQGSGNYLDFGRHLGSMPNVATYFHDVPQALAIAREPDGRILSIPGDAGEDFDGSAAHLFVNRVWLDRFGLEVPATWDELTDVLTAFRDGDPNGNGHADEIPMALRPPEELPDRHLAENDAKPDGWLLWMNAAGIPTQLNEVPGTGGYYARNGEMRNFAESPEFQAVVEFLTRLGGERLIGADAFEAAHASKRINDAMREAAANGRLPENLPTVDGQVGLTIERYRAQLSAATPIVGMAFARDASAFGANADEYVSIPVPTRFPDTPIVWDRTSRIRFNLSGVSVRTDTVKLDQALKAVDALFSEPVSLAQYYGERGAAITRESDHYRVAVTDMSSGYAHDFAGWIRPGTVIESDRDRELYRAADEPYEPIYAAMDERWNDGGTLPVPILADAEQFNRNSDATYIGILMDRYAAARIYAGEDGSDAAAAWLDYTDTLHTAADTSRTLQYWQTRRDAYAKTPDAVVGGPVTLPGRNQSLTR